MPAFDVTLEFATGVEYPVKVFLVMHGSGQAVPKHPLCQRLQVVNRIILEKAGSPRRVAFCRVNSRRRSILIELKFHFQAILESKLPSPSLRRVSHLMHGVVRIIPPAMAL